MASAFLVASALNRKPDHRRGETGSALLIVLTLTFLFSALAIGTTTVVSVETVVSGRFRDGVEAVYVADAGLALVAAELRDLPDWNPILNGAIRSGLSRGPFLGPAPVAGGSVVLCCGGLSVGARLARESAVDPVPARRGLAWRPYLWSAWDAVVPQPRPVPLFLVVFVQDDAEDGDTDGTTDLNGTVVIRAETIRPDGLRRVVEALVVRQPGDPSAPLPDRIRILHWREVR
jgi:hypothetical protein